MTEEKINQIIKLVQEEAQSRIAEASFNGKHNDSGGQQMLDDIDTYLAGKQGIIPEQWEQYSNRLDPEYPEYQRLKEKFRS